MIPLSPVHKTFFCSFVLLFFSSFLIFFFFFNSFLFAHLREFFDFCIATYLHIDIYAFQAGVVEFIVVVIKNVSARK